jgi:predicted O-methyltransferase YrrM
MSDKNYEFTVDWSTAHVQAWTNVLGRTGVKPDRILEIGVFEGRSTTWMIETLRPSLLVAIDDWSASGMQAIGLQKMPDAERRFDGNVAIATAKSPGTEVKKTKSSSARALASLIASGVEPFDLIYIDGDHRAPGALSDLVMAFHLAKVGGLIFCDDYLWRLDKGLLETPKLAIDSFVNCYRFKLKIFQERLAQIYLQKTAD